MAYTTINKSSDYFNTKLYTGNFTDNTDITGVGFQPDLVWLKERSSTSSHLLQDAVRGANKDLFSNETSDEESNTNRMKAFISDGFTLGAHNLSNQNGETYASWNWKANGAGSANTDGDVTSTVSINTTSGFSIVKWDSTGTAGINIGHGLGQKPAMIIAKSTNINGTSWPVYHQSLGATKYLTLNNTTAGQTSSTRWNNSEPTTTTFQTGSSGDIGGSDRTMIAYCFAEKQGYSKIGSYTGNGNADGTFVYTGFKPSFILAKRTDATAGWVLFDNKRIGYNGSGNYWLDAQNNEADQTDATGMFDQLSNGFKVRSSFGSRNASGGNYIYIAFGQSLVGSNNVPCTAR